MTNDRARDGRQAEYGPFVLSCLRVFVLCAHLVRHSAFSIRPSPLVRRRFAGHGAVGCALLSLCAMTAAGCVRRTITISTEPPNALVFLNDQEIGRSTVSTDFLWYGDYEVIIRKKGHETLQTNWPIKPPWYQVPPFDFFAEVLWPGWLHNHHERHFVLRPAEPPSQKELIERAIETRDRALESR